jgi:hypothetical protein
VRFSLDAPWSAVSTSAMIDSAADIDPALTAQGYPDGTVYPLVVNERLCS